MPVASWASCFTADYSFVNEGLAAHTGSTQSSGTALQRRQFRIGGRNTARLAGARQCARQLCPFRSDTRRLAGLLVRRTLLCQELPTPPPNAGGVPAATLQRRRASASGSTRRARSARAATSSSTAWALVSSASMPSAGPGQRAWVPIDDSGDQRPVGPGSGQAGPYRGLASWSATLDCGSAAQLLRSADAALQSGEREDVAADLARSSGWCAPTRNRLRIRDLWRPASSQNFCFDAKAKKRGTSMKIARRQPGLGTAVAGAGPLLGRSRSRFVHAAPAVARRVLFFYFPDGSGGTTASGEPSLWHAKRPGARFCSERSAASARSRCAMTAFFKRPEHGADR